MPKQDIMTMSKIELQEYAKRARYMLGKAYSERLQLEQENAELKQDVEKLLNQLKGNK